MNPSCGQHSRQAGRKISRQAKGTASETSQFVDGSELPMDEEEQLAPGVLQLTGGTC